MSTARNSHYPIGLFLPIQVISILAKFLFEFDTPTPEKSFRFHECICSLHFIRFLHLVIPSKTAGYPPPLTTPLLSPRARLHTILLRLF